MSAIGGLWRLDGRAIDQRDLSGMIDRARLRGPDGLVVEMDGSMALYTCHFDTGGGAKVGFCSEDGLILTLDGRIDNREELCGAGCLVQGQGEHDDARLFLACYRRWGLACLERVIGDWAVAVADTRTRQVVLARDPMGLRPLVYHTTPSAYVWGSEIGQITAWSELHPSLQEDALAEFLLSPLLPVYPPDDSKTVYTNVYRVPHGHYLLLDSTTHVCKPFWSLKERTGRCSREEYVDRFRQLLEQSIRARLRACSSAVVHLSGGLDSSSVACVAKRLCDRGEGDGCPQLVTLSWLVSRDEPGEDWPFIQAVLPHLNVPARFAYYDEEWILKGLGTAAPLYDEPSTSMLGHSRTLQEASLARSVGSRVVISGHGGDHLSTGTPLYLANWFTQFQMWRFARQILSYYRRAESLWFAVGVALWGIIPRIAYRKLSGETRRVPPWIRPEVVTRFVLQEKLTSAWEAWFGRGSFRRMDLQDLRSLAGSLVDLAPRLFGFEVRAPYADRRMVEFAMSVPPELKWSEGLTRVVAREAMRGIVPAKVLENPVKSGLTRILRPGLRREWATIVGLLRDGRCRIAEYVDIDVLLDWLDRCRHGVLERYIMGALAPVVLEVWLRSRRRAEMIEVAGGQG